MKLKEHLEIYFNLVDDVRNQSYIKYKLSDVLLVCGIFRNVLNKSLNLKKQICIDGKTICSTASMTE